MVGAVVARNQRVLAEACHEEFGGPHAEAAALAVSGDARDATLYTSLEPCRHTGKTPPCTEAIRSAGVSRVVYWAADPGPESGGGGAWLRHRGCRVDGPFGHRAHWAAENPVFFHTRKAIRPFVGLKLAMSLDGRIAPAGGQRVWLTGREAREEVHRLRAGFDGILVGTRTWKADDPRLTARGSVVPRILPVRIILDRRGEVPGSAQVLADDPPTLVVTSSCEAPGLRDRLGGRADVLAVPVAGTRLDLRELFQRLARRGLTSVLCEGGGTLAVSLLAGGLVDRIYIFVAPLFVGGKGIPAFPVADFLNVKAPARSFGGWKLRLDPARFGDDTLIVWDRGG